jgi:ATP-dependent DNA helicase RecG
MAADPVTLAELSTFGTDRLEGLGPKKTAALSQMGIHSLLDLLFHYPRRYVDRTRQEAIQDLAENTEVTVVGEVRQVDSRRVRGNRSMVTATITDGSGRLKCTFFNQPWRAKQLQSGSGPLSVAVFGKVTAYRGSLQMTNPVVDLLGDRTGKIVPIYPQSEKAGLTSWEIGDWVAQTLRRCKARGLSDPVPGAVLADLDLIGRADAYEGIHAPTSMGQVEVSRRRLVFDELLRIQLSLVRTKREVELTAKGFSHDWDAAMGGSGLVAGFLRSLPFEPTGAQRRAVASIGEDMASPIPMHRLLQGDVGSGKTIVAVAALLGAVQGDHQGAFMAPTEVLAEQHYASVTAMLGDLSVASATNLFGSRPVTVELLTGRVPAADRRRLLEGLATREVDIVVGTHALIQESVSFASLGAVVVDEQHRFGVEQRAALRSVNADGVQPDMLVMTATPIPRTAAMTVYGDLDVTVLDELPPGRTPISTSIAATPQQVSDTWELVRSEVSKGQRAYVVCPLIDPSETKLAASAEAVKVTLESGELSDCRVGLLHGRMKSDEKREVMDAFRAGEIEVLVATTVIEVGVDVPAATVMVILDADSFGIAQLHQLRGRVGRGAAVSHCVLVASIEDATEDGQARLEALAGSNDGFVLAEVDLELRGEGTVMGERQKGRSDLKLASLSRDLKWVEKARKVAFDLVHPANGLADHPLLAEEIDVLLAPEDEEFLTKS